MTQNRVSFSIRCETCSYRRTFGYAPVTADVKATTHAWRRPGHVIHVLRDGKIDHTIDHTADQPTLDDQPPF